MLNGSFWLEADSTREAWHNYDWGRQGRKKEGKEGPMKSGGNNDWGRQGRKEEGKEGMTGKDGKKVL